MANLVDVGMLHAECPLELFIVILVVAAANDGRLLRGIQA